MAGGARMAGIRAMGDLSHEVESFLEVVESGQRTVDADAFEVLQASLDELHRMREMANSGQRIPAARELILRLRGPRASTVITQHYPADKAETFMAWQREVAALAGAYPGYQATELPGQVRAFETQSKGTQNAMVLRLGVILLTD